MNKFIDDKIILAKKLYDCCDMATYADGTLILCAALSAIAEKIWHRNSKDRIDSKRFPELIVRYTDINLKKDWVSIPLLHQKLQNESPFTKKES